MTLCPGLSSQTSPGLISPFLGVLGDPPTSPHHTHTLATCSILQILSHISVHQSRCLARGKHVWGVNQQIWYFKALDSRPLTAGLVSRVIGLMTLETLQVWIRSTQ